MTVFRTATSQTFFFSMHVGAKELRRLISSAFISSVSVLKRHFFNNVEFCTADIISLQVLYESRWDLMAKLYELWLLQRWFSILTNSCLVIIQKYSMTCSCYKSMYIDRPCSSRLE